jgi:hypothetical protein
MQELIINVASVIFGIGSLFGAFCSATKLRPLSSHGKGPDYPISRSGESHWEYWELRRLVMEFVA